MKDRLRRAWRELVGRTGATDPPSQPVIGPADGEDVWEWAQRKAIEWQLHVEEGELRLEVARKRMRETVLAEGDGTVLAEGCGSGERGAE